MRGFITVGLQAGNLENVVGAPGNPEQGPFSPNQAAVEFLGSPPTVLNI